MTFEINVVFCVLVVLTGSSQTRGHSSAFPPVLTRADGSSAPPHLTDGPGKDVPQRTHNPAGRDETSTGTKTEATIRSETSTNAAHKTDLLTTSAAVVTSQHSNEPVVVTPSAATNSLSSAATPPRRPSTSLSSPPAHTVQDPRPTASTPQPQSESPLTAAAAATAGHPLTSGRGPAGHRDVPSELNVGDEDLKGLHTSSPLDPLLAGLLSVFIVTTAVVFIILFLKFRQRTNHPEFHRLQDLPMDDLMEDTPLSRYTY